MHLLAALLHAAACPTALLGPLDAALAPHRGAGELWGLGVDAAVLGAVVEQAARRARDAGRLELAVGLYLRMPETCAAAAMDV